MSEKQGDYKNEFKHRLMQESHELTVKIDKLSTFIEGEHFCKVEDIQRVLLTIQLDAMRTYSSCLIARIDAL